VTRNYTVSVYRIAYGRKYGDLLATYYSDAATLEGAVADARALELEEGQFTVVRRGHVG
jgi:hypothetical protein